MDRLRLIALDSEDLAVISAHLQDAVLKVGDMKWLKREGRFVLGLNRFAWETSGEGKRKRHFERRRSVLHFDRVQQVAAQNIHQERPDAVLDLLAIRFEETVTPAGEVSLIFAGGGEVKLTVECIEAQLSDLGPAWGTENRPTHDVEAD